LHAPPLNRRLFTQTAPTKDESLFTNVIAAANLVASAAPAVTKGLLSSANVPVARYLRWQIIGPAGTWDATFRVLIAANSPGM
jgi:hypothetical protein